MGEKYYLLTVNGITKICSSKIYTYNGEIIPLQWYNFQLVWLLTKLELYPEQKSVLEQAVKKGPAHLKFLHKKQSGYLNITNTSIWNKLKQEYPPIEEEEHQQGNDLEYTLIRIPEKIFNEKITDSGEIANYGFTKPKFPYKINDINNELIFGGYSQFEPRISNNGAYIEIDHIETSGVEESKDEEPPELFFGPDDIRNQKFPFFEGEREAPKLGFESIKEGSVKRATELSAARAAKTDLATTWVQEQNGKNPCYRGFFMWNANSCYADSVIYLLYRSFINRPSSFLAPLINKSYTAQNLGEYQCVDIDGRVDKVNNILKILKNMFGEFSKNKVIYIKDLLENIVTCMDLQPNAPNNFNDGGPHSPTEFLTTLLNIIYSDRVTPNLIEYRIGTVAFEQLKIPEILRAHTREDLIRYFEGMVSQNSGVERVDKAKPEKVQLFNMELSRVNAILKNLPWLNGKDGSSEKFILSPSESVQGDVIKMYGLNINKADKTKVKKYIEETGIDITEFLYWVDRKAHQMLDKDWKIDAAVITNDAEDIFFWIERQVRDQSECSAKINPIDFTIEGSEYKLNGIVYVPYRGHYAMVFNCGGKYYKYDDNAPDGEWITEIGDSIENLEPVMLNQSAIYHYIRDD